MSMSSLSAQLASLNAAAGSKNTGSNLGSSKRHEDAVGRGIRHSVKHGHSIHASGDPKHKPSVLYADSRAASDVPLTTLRENALSSLRQLAKLTGNTAFCDPQYLQTLCGIHSLQFERGLATATENAKMDAVIGDLLLLLCTAMGESASTSGTSCFSSCLHIIEYLLRRYDVHLRQSCAEQLLICGLPHHEQPVFMRILQLVDLASMPTWAFLRPYAAKGSSFPTRTVLAKRASKDTAFVKICCRLAKKAAKIHVEEQVGDLVRTGISRIISFVAAELVEAVSLQAAATGSIAEGTLRCILPFVLNATGGKDALGIECPDWRGFGHVLASCIAEHSVLSREARQALATSLIQGAVELQNHLEKHNVENKMIVESVSNSVVTLMAVLSTSADADSEETQLAVVGKNNQERFLGFPLPVPTYRAIVNLSSFVAVLGYLRVERGFEVANLVASVLVASVEKNNTDMILKLIAEPMLNGLWKDSRINLTSSFTAIVVATASESDDAEKLDDSKTILDALKRVHATGCDSGIAYAVTGRKYGKMSKKRIAGLLGLSLSGTEDQSSDTTLLPSRVALEHADKAVRLNAIERLLEDDWHDDGSETLEMALLRHFTVEDDLEVVVACGKALLSLFESGRVSLTVALAEKTLMAIEKWTVTEGLVDTQKSQHNKTPVRLIVLDLVLSIGAYSSRVSDSELRQGVVCTMVAHLDIAAAESFSHISKSVAGSIFFALIPDATILVPKMLKDVSASVVSDDGIKSAIQEMNETEKHSFSAALGRRFLIAYISSAVAVLSKKSSRKSKTSGKVFSDEAMTACLLLLRSMSASTSSDSQTYLVKECIMLCSERVDANSLPTTVMSLAAVSSDECYDDVVQPAIRAICEGKNDGYSQVSLLVESAARSSDSVVVKRLLALVKDQASDSKDSDAVLVPLLSFLGHVDQEVRSAALRVLSDFRELISAELSVYCKVLSEGIEHENLSSIILMDGSSALPAFFRRALDLPRNKKKSRSSLLSLCASAVLDTKGVFDPDRIFGLCRAVSVVLNAAEFAGEASFPLLARWEHAGSKIYHAMLKTDSTSASVGVDLLINSVVRMLKGAAIDDASTLNNEVIITTGPGSTGARARSYSVGQSGGISLLDPYPSQMLEAVNDCLAQKDRISTEGPSIVKTVCTTLLEEVVGRHSWGDTVLKSLSEKDRRTVGINMLNLRSIEELPSTDAFLNLYLEVADVRDLIQTTMTEEVDLESLTFVTDYIRSNTEFLSKQTGVSELVSTLFNALGELSSAVETNVAVDDIEFARLATLSCLSSIMAASESTTTKSSIVAKAGLPQRTALLVELIGCGTSKVKDKYIPLRSWRGKSAALSLLTCMCSIHPKSIVKLLIPAMTSLFVVEQSGNKSGQTGSSPSAVRETLIVMVPVFCQNADSADLSIFDLFNAFLSEMSNLDNEWAEYELSKCIVDALRGVNSESVPSPIGCFMAFFVAALARKPRLRKQDIIMLAEVLQHTDVPAQVRALHQLFAVVNSAVSYVSDTDAEVEGSEILDHLLTILSRGPDDSMKVDDVESSVLLTRFAFSAMRLSLECLRNPLVGDFVSRGEESEAAACLQLWQDLLLLQTATLDLYGEETDDTQQQEVDSLKNYVEDCLATFQQLLPVPFFLASATSLIKEGSTLEMRSKAVRLLSQRAESIEADSPEALLFLETIPMLVSLLDTQNERTESDHVIVQQSAATAIEQLARSFCLAVGDASVKKCKDDFFSALEACSHLLGVVAPDIIKTGFASQVQACQLACSVALCAATLVQVLKARCLPLLPQLVDPLLAILSTVNGTILKETESIDSAAGRNNAVTMQLSVLRAITAISGCLPHFLVPYLTRLLAPSMLPSIALHEQQSGDDDSGLNLTVQKLEATLAKQTPARQLLPACCKALADCNQVVERQTLLVLMKNSVQESSRTELATMRSWVVKAIIMAYDSDEETTERIGLLDTVSSLFLALVLKLSEAQLRPVFSKLREWKSDDESSSKLLSSRRFAFWSLSAVLSRALRSIFLPCMSTVVGDAVIELNYALSLLRPDSQMVKSGKKKRKIAPPTDDEIQSLCYLQPLLLSLELSFKADAQEGGQWVRSDDGNRFHTLLEPLGRLLQCHVPSGFPFGAVSGSETSSSVFQRLVQGRDSDNAGNVVSCITTLAAAAGNEQLWKPLNHEVLQACGHEHRPEVRKAGVTCLLSLIKTLGEEYMVLLPECLPVISELLEDSDEETAGLAQQCVSISEDLLGESLMDSLR